MEKQRLEGICSYFGSFFSFRCRPEFDSGFLTAPGFMLKWGVERRLPGYFRALAVLLQKFTQVKYWRDLRRRFSDAEFFARAFVSVGKKEYF